MCGIAGMVGLHSDRKMQEEMLSTMHRRGPDGHGFFQEGSCCLLHSRLAIIDPTGGGQPMHLCWQDEEYTIVYNGELYNTREIRGQLLKCGHVFNTTSDTEVVLHAYAQWKESSLERFNGILAFAVWEHKRKRLFIGRDRIGVKPLFYKLHEGGIIFASEIKTILKYPTVRAQIDEEGAAEILLLGPGRTPGCGVFKGIKELEPGCYAEYEKGVFTWHRYWKLEDREHKDSFEDTAAYVRFLVTDSIKRQMVSDVPIGTFLSGGLDSSIISSICAAEKRAHGEQLQTFSVDYVNNEQFFVAGKFQPESDNAYINIMQDYLDSEHHWSVLTPEDLVRSLEAATSARDLPGMADVDFSLLAFCGHIRSHVKVALSGECADEIFGGYPWYRDPDVRAMDGFPWAQNTKERAGFLSAQLRQKLRPDEYVQDKYRQTIDQCDILPGTSPEERRMKEMVNLNHRWFMQTLLDRKDRMSMYNGLEVRVPFCDYRIAGYLYGVPWGFKDYQGREKGLLRYAMEGVLPPEVLHRKKSPYPKTYDPKYLQIVGGQMERLLEDCNAPLFQLVDQDALRLLLTAEYTWPWYGQLMKVPQTIAYMLQINAWLQTYNIEVKI